MRCSHTAKGFSPNHAISSAPGFVWINIRQEVEPEVGSMCVEGLADPGRGKRGDGILVLATGFPFRLTYSQPASNVYSFARPSNHATDK